MPSKPIVRIAAGVLHNEQGQYLLSSRPAGKSKAGYWEFAGGKIETGETLFAALQREFEEELGIHVHHALPWLTRRHLYPEKQIEFNLFHIPHDGWSGEPQSREQQQWLWQSPNQAITVRVLPSNRPILRALRIPRQLKGSPETGFYSDNGFHAQPYHNPQPEQPIIIPFGQNLPDNQTIDSQWILVRDRHQYRQSPQADAWVWHAHDAQSCCQLKQVLRQGTPQPLIIYATPYTIAQYQHQWLDFGVHAIVPQAT